MTPPSLPVAVLLLLAGVQFTNIMDFMVMMPLGPQLMRVLKIGPAEVGRLISSYEWTSALCGVAAAFFIDKFPRKGALLACYAGFIFGTAGCALADDYTTLLVMRALAGAFGGLLGSLVMAFAADVSPPQLRGSAMGMVMAAFSVASVLGVPVGLWLATRYSWQFAFWLVAGMATLLWALALVRLPRPAVAPRAAGAGNAFFSVVRQPNALLALSLIMLLVASHFTVVPFMSPYLVRNVGLTEAQLPLIYLTGGALTLFTTPWIGRLVDRLGRVRVLAVLTVIATGVILLVTHMPPWPLFAVLAAAGGFFIFGAGRFVPGQAILSTAVSPAERGAFMSLSSAARDFTAGCIALLAGHVVWEDGGGKLHGFSRLGWLAVAAGALSLWIASRVRVVESGAPVSAAAVEG